MRPKTDRLAFGFTLIELMLVVAIISVLSAIALPKFSNLIVKSKEAAVKGQLGSLRSGLAIYYSDLEGVWPNIILPQLSPPEDKYGFFDGHHYAAIGIPKTPHAGVTGWWVNNYGYFGSTGPDDFALAPGNAYAWYYDARSGVVVVNCTHTDSQGSVWSQW